MYLHVDSLSFFSQQLRAHLERVLSDEAWRRTLISNVQSIINTQYTARLYLCHHLLSKHLTLPLKSFDIPLILSRNHSEITCI